MVAESAVWSLAVVVLEPAFERASSLLVVVVDDGVCPLSKQGLDEPLGFAVGARSVGLSAQVSDPELGTRAPV